MNKRVMEIMKVLLVSMMYEYGDKYQGLSYDYYHFFQCLKQLVDSVVFFDFMGVIQEQGKERMNRELLETVKRERPDVAIVVPYTDQFIPEVVDEINEHTITVGYFFDTMWRVEYTRFWAGHFTFVTTSDTNGVQKFRDAGYNNVIYSPFACNHHIFIKKDIPKVYDVSFVGQYHPYRAWYLKQLKKAKINVQVWGHRWKTGRLDQDGMVNAFNQSRINLNLSNSVSWDLRYLLSSPRAIKNTLGSIGKRDYKVREQVKGRHFEINACGGFQLSYYVEGLERCYQIGEEIALYESPEELVEKIRYYLKHEDEREAIAKRGYERTLAEHTMEQRFRQLFEHIRFSIPNP